MVTPTGIQMMPMLCVDSLDTFSEVIITVLAMVLDHVQTNNW